MTMSILTILIMILLCFLIDHVIPTKTSNNNKQQASERYIYLYLSICVERTIDRFLTTDFVTDMHVRDEYKHVMVVLFHVHLRNIKDMRTSRSNGVDEMTTYMRRYVLGHDKACFLP
jgi:hypothetical protein